MTFPDLEALRTKFGVPEHDYDERLDARLLADPEISALVIRSLHRDSNLTSALTYYVTWPRSTMSAQTTCAALIDPKTGAVLDSDCSRYIVGRPAGLDHRRSTTPCRDRAGLWAALAIDEDEAVTAFERHVAELVLWKAPPQLIQRARDAMADEQRHRELALAIATRLHGSEVSFERPRTRADLRTSVVEMACDVASGGALNELVNVALLLEAARVAEPLEAAVLESIASDEAAHAALAWDTLEWLMPRLTPVERQAVYKALRPRAVPANTIGLDQAAIDRASGAAFEAAQELTAQLSAA